MEKEKLLYDSPLWTYEGITGAARNYIYSLMKYYDIMLSDIRYNSKYDINGTLKDCYNIIDIKKDDFIYIKNTRPETLPYFKYKNSFAYHVLEGDSFPYIHVEGINQSNIKCLFVPSNYVKQAAINSKINKPIEVMPHIISEDFKYIEKKNNDKTIFFYSAAIYGLTEKDRKGTDILLKAWKKYGKDEDKELIIKINDLYAKNYYSSLGIKFNLNDYLMKLYGSKLPNNIKIIQSDKERVNIIELYQQADCILYPTRGEGFGLVPFEGLACGTPVIVTEKQGCDEYLNFITGGFLKIKIIKKIPALKLFPYYDGKNWSNWDEPSLNDFQEKIDLFLANKTKYINEAKEASKWIHKEFSSENIGKKFHNIIQEYKE